MQLIFNTQVQGKAEDEFNDILIFVIGVFKIRPVLE